MRVARFVLLALVLGLLGAPAASAATEAVVGIDVTGAGNMRFKVEGTTLTDLCTGIPRPAPPGANLANPTGVQQRLCTERFTVNGCPGGQAPPCDIKATVTAIRPTTPQLTRAEADLVPPHWRYAGWTTAPGGCTPGDPTVR